MKLVIFLLQLYLLSHSLTTYANPNIDTVSNSVVKIYATLASPNYQIPWQLNEPQQVVGSAVIISNQRILTNAHVVTYAKYIQVQKNKDPNKYVAEINFIAPDADLAILTIKDKDFFKNTRPLTIEGLPKPYQEVAAFGYPIGGETLSITKGILSRYEYSSYVNSGMDFLQGQIDAAINPGNSGGPVVVNQKVVGLVMQELNNDESNKIGYFIPAPIINHVLKDIEDGKYDGFSKIDFLTEPLANPNAKAYFGLKSKQTGIIIRKVFPNTEASKILQKNDILLKIDQFPIADDGSIVYNSILQTNFNYISDLHHIGDTIQYTFARKGQIFTAALKLQPAKSHELILSFNSEMSPRYYVYGGIVFMPINLDLMYAIRYKPYFSERYITENKTELVMATKILSNDVNFGYDSFEKWTVEFVNGIPIRNFAHFANLLENNQNKYVIFENKEGNQMIINHQQALQNEASIFRNYGVPARYSKGLFDSPKTR